MKVYVSAKDCSCDECGAEILEGDEYYFEEIESTTLCSECGEKGDAID